MSEAPERASRAPGEFTLGELPVVPVPAEAPGAPEDRPRRRSRRRRGASAAAGPRPRFLAATDPVLRWGPAALLLFAPLAWGSVEAWSELVVIAGAAVVGATWILRIALYPEASAAERSAGSHLGSWSGGLHAALLALLAVGAAQLLPLGPLAGLLSPVAEQVQRGSGIGAGSLTLSLARGETQRALALYVAYALIFLAVLDGLPGRAETRRLAAVMLTLGFAHAIGGILWHYRSVGSTYWGQIPGAGSFGPYVNRNHFACLMAMTLPLGVGHLLSLARRREAEPSPEPRPGRPAEPAGAEAAMRRVLFGFMAAVMAGALALSLSRGGIVSGLAALAVLFAGLAARRATRGHLATAGAAVAAALAFAVWLAAQPLLERLGSLTGLFAADGALAPRTGIWDDTLRMAADFPLFGAGLGTFAEVYPRYQSAYAGSVVEHAHSDWLQLLAEGGLAGTLAVLGLIGAYAAVAGRLLARRRDPEALLLALGGIGGLCAFGLHAFSEFNARIPANALWFTALAALTLKALASRRERAG